MPIRSERKDAAEHRQLILRTAVSLFRQHGVAGVSMHQIAKTAGVGQGTLYRRYAHKGDLCLDILQDYSQSFMDSVQQFLSDNGGLPPEERLGWLLDCWIDVMEQNSELILTIESHLHKKSEELQCGNIFQSLLYRFLREQISSLMTEIAAVPSDSRPDPVLAAHSLICAMAPSGYFHMKQEYGRTTRELKNHYRRLCGVPAVEEDG